MVIFQYFTHFHLAVTSRHTHTFTINTTMKQRIIFLDYMRVIACFMVIMVHSCEFFFIDGSNIGIRSISDGWWVSVIDSAFRCSVPLFVMISAYLLMPVTTDARCFFKKRLVRVVIPFLIWSVLYATLPYLWGDMTGDDVAALLLRLAYNFNDASGHMWFVYMLIGLYLFMPVISPWLEKAGSKGEKCFLALWLASTFFPYIRNFAGDVYGECYWNEFNMLWYFSGFMGYVVLAHYIRNFISWPRHKSIIAGAIAYIIGYAITATIWYGRIETSETLQQLELSWRFCTPNVVLESIGAFLIIKGIFTRTKENKVITSISNLSYGIYLMHIFILTAVYRILANTMSTPLTIVTVGATTFVLCYLITAMLSYLPKSKYLIG